jgi:hypothetical protein
MDHWEVGRRWNANADFMNFMDIPETGRLIAEARRVLKPGGSLQFSIAHSCAKATLKRGVGKVDKERVKEMARSPNHIPGIYNYCDRWCERCTFTSRCLSFAMDEENDEENETRDLNNEQFWQRISDSFRVALELLHEMAEEQGIDLSEIPESDDESEDIELQHEKAREHELAQAAQAYWKMVDSWFDAAAPLFDAQTDLFDLEPMPELEVGDPIEEAARLQEAIEVIRWYQHFLYPKLMRALEGEFGDRPEILDGLPTDSDGSAKIALIAMDCSIAAWGEMLRHFPSQEDEILDLLMHLERLRRKTESFFPDARAFVRPGFDTENP